MGTADETHEAATRFVQACTKQVAYMAIVPRLNGDTMLHLDVRRRALTDAHAILAAAMAVTAAAESAIHSIMRKE